jgi:hypothetical protein
VCVNNQGPQHGKQMTNRKETNHPIDFVVLENVYCPFKVAEMMLEPAECGACGVDLRMAEV